MTQLQYSVCLNELIQKVEQARVMVSEHHIVKIIAVSKYSSSDDIKTLYSVGQRAFGENKVQDLLQKEQDLEDLPLQWHFIGHLQKNKINQLIKANPSLIQSIDSLELAQELDKHLKARDLNFDALLQINSAYESTKSGILPEHALEIYEQINTTCKCINLKGVMSIGAHTEDKKIVQKSFEITHKIYSQLDNASICSMGMSHDFELAISCGSNMVRIGSILFNKI